MSENFSSDAIAIVGMSCRFPGAENVCAFWDNLKTGVDALVTLSDEQLREAKVSEALRQNPRYIKRAALIQDIDCFDAEFFSYSEHEANLIDPQQRIFLEEVYHCFEDAGLNPFDVSEKVGVFAGTSLNTYFLQYIQQHTDFMAHPAEFAMLLHANGVDYLSTRVAYKYGFTGPAVSVQTACSSSLAAVHEACNALRNFECDLSVAGGVSVLLPQNHGYLFEPGSLLSKDGYCRVFDKNASGTVFGSGVGVVLLKRYEEAIKDNDRIYAIIRGSARNNDGKRKAGFSAPSVQGQSEVIAMALNFSDVAPEEISYIEAHGTGTEMGDTIEIAALSHIFNFSSTRPCIIGSVKTNIGHLLAAAGIAGLMKTALMIYHRWLVPHLHYEAASKNIDFSKNNFCVNTSSKLWHDDSEQYLSGVSSFGIGGTNIHLILGSSPVDAGRHKEMFPSLYAFKRTRHWYAEKEVLQQPASTISFIPPRVDKKLSLNALLTMVQQLLGLQSMQAHEDFFDLGGHSLLFSQLMTKLDEEFDIAIDMKDIYEHSTVHKLHGHILEKANEHE